MDTAYDGDMPYTCPGYFLSGCSDHTPQSTETIQCAWMEGWATFWTLTVTDDPVWNWPDYKELDPIDLEDPTWGTEGWQDGPEVEGRVAGALWDICDNTPSEGYDTYDGVFSDIWAIFSRENGHDATFLKFWQAWLDGEKNKAAKGALWQSTTICVPGGETATLQGHERPYPVPNGYDVPLTVKFYDNDLKLDINNIMDESLWLNKADLYP